MRIDSPALESINSAEDIEPRYVVEMAFDDPATDFIYLTSHYDCDLPGTATVSNTFYNTLRNVHGTNQKLDPIKARSSIGGGQFDVLDIDQVVSEYIRDKWITDKSLTRKRVRTYVGGKGIEFSEYALIGTRNKFGHRFDGLVYTFMLEDIQRTVKKDVFDERKTNLLSSITIDQVAIPVTDLTNASAAFEMNWHDGNYSDAPNETVGYVRLKEKGNIEIIRYKQMLDTADGAIGSDIFFSASDQSINSTSTDLSTFAVAGMLLNISGSASNNLSVIANSVSTNKITCYGLDGAGTAGIVDESAGASVSVDAPVQFYQCARGVLNTRSYPVTVDANLSDDRKPAVTEHIFLETTLPKIAYGVLTGVWYGTAHTLPSNWHLGIDTSLVNSASFINKSDLWNTGTDAGKVYRFSGNKKTDAKAWLAEKVCLPMSCFLRVLNDGDIALYRFTRTLHDASHVAVLGPGDIRDFSELYYDDSQIFNIFNIDWNHEPEKEGTTRRNQLVDEVSKAINLDTTEELYISLDGLHGSIHTEKDLRDTFDMLRDRHAGPPIIWQIRAMYKWNKLEIGDVIRVTLPNVYDATNKAVTYVDRAFEIQGKQVDWVTGDVTLDLFGSTMEAGAIAWDSSSAYQFVDAFYSSLGTNFNTLPGATLVGSTLQLTADCTITGNASMNASGAIWYTDYNLQINAGVTVTITNNVQMRVKGFWQNNGTIDGRGQGLAGSSYSAPYASGTSGWVGNTQGGGSGYVGHQVSGNVNFTYWDQRAAPLSQGVYSSFPFLHLTNNAGYLEGLPDDMRSSSGGSGHGLYIDGSHYASGGNGGDAPAALVVICRGGAFGGSGHINLSGLAGTAGASASFNNGQFSAVSGEGASSFPGVCLFIIDGKASTKPSNQLVADWPKTQQIGHQVETDGKVWNRILYATKTEKGLPLHAYGIGSHQGIGYDIDCSASNFRVMPAPANLAPAIDQPDTADIASFSSVVETQNSPSTVAQNLSTVQIDLTPPVGDSNYQYSNVYYKLLGQSDDEYVLVGPALNSVTLPPTTMDGAVYDIIAKPVSKKGIESTEYIHTTVTVSTASGGAILGNGNYLSLGKTSYADTTPGAWIEKYASGMRANFGTSTKYVKIDTGAGTVVEIVGKATIDEGTIGGFTITATEIKSGTNIGLNASTKALWINSSTFATAGIQLQYNGGSPQFYVGNGTGNYFKYTTAGGIETGGGVIKEFQIELYTSGIIQNNSAPATNGGFKLDKDYFRFWNTSSQVTFEIKASDGSFLAGIESTNKYLKFDSTAGTFVVGPEVILTSSESFNSSNTYISGRLSDFTYNSITTGAGSITNTTSGGRTTVSSGGSAGYAELLVACESGFQTLTFGKSRHFKLRAKFNGTGADSLIGMGAAGGANRIQIKYQQSTGNLIAEASAGGSISTVTLISSYTTGVYQTFDIIFTAGTSAKFYVDGTLYGTITTNLPTTSTYGSNLLMIRSDWVTGSGGSVDATVLRVNQLP